VTEFARVAVASRAFTLASILGLGLAYNNTVAVQVTLVVTAIAASATYLSWSTALPNHLITAIEAGLATLVVSQALPESLVLLPYLVVLPLIAGLARGPRGAVLSIALQLLAALTLALASAGLGGLIDRTELLAPWTLMIIGSGLLGAWVRKLGKSPAGNKGAEHYEIARRLLGQLRALARRLSSGLDPAEISDQILTLTHLRLRDERSALFVRTEGRDLAPLSFRGQGAQELLHPIDPVVDCWRSGTVMRIDLDPAEASTPRCLLLPLRVGTDILGVLVSCGRHEVGRGEIDALLSELDDPCLRLDTALAFDEVRSLLTADERQRVAREIHDGVAQEVASLGYLVDEISAKTEDYQVLEGLNELRGEVSRVVTELRHSIFDLRADAAANGGLGSALSEHARRIGRQSGIAVHLTLDEAPQRLTPIVETELLRIAQEAITNARKHSAAKNLWIHCLVKPPAARIEIQDDGDGLGAARDDSFGLTIMRERAERIGAQLSFTPWRSTGGTCVTISVGGAMAARLGEQVSR
jgi:signal transduction histidine kinase